MFKLVEINGFGVLFFFVFFWSNREAGGKTQEQQSRLVNGESILFDTAPIFVIYILAEK